jgi:putative aminopeptidase FrvX
VTGTDANVIQLSRAGVATGLVSVPNRYMHSSCEMVSLGDVDRVIELLAATVARLGPAMEWTPF